MFGPSIARTIVSYTGSQKVGTGMAWCGVNQISAKREWPDWKPPEEMLRRRPDLPRHVTGGIDNPLGARAIRSALDSSRAQLGRAAMPPTL
ncbi:MAG: hypothetical protein ACXWCY_34080 [Burkholderiales bacterium]